MLFEKVCVCFAHGRSSDVDPTIVVTAIDRPVAVSEISIIHGTTIDFAIRTSVVVSISIESNVFSTVCFAVEHFELSILGSIMVASSFHMPFREICAFVSSNANRENYELDEFCTTLRIVEVKLHSASASIVSRWRRFDDEAQ